MHTHDCDHKPPTLWLMTSAEQPPSQSKSPARGPFPMLSTLQPAALPYSMSSLVQLLAKFALKGALLYQAQALAWFLLVFFRELLHGSHSVLHLPTCLSQQNRDSEKRRGNGTTKGKTGRGPLPLCSLPGCLSSWERHPAFVSSCWIPLCRLCFALLCNKLLF